MLSCQDLLAVKLCFQNVPPPVDLNDQNRLKRGQVMLRPGGRETGLDGLHRGAFDPDLGGVLDLEDAPDGRKQVVYLRVEFIV